MAFTPCAVHGKGYAGAASTFFLRLVDRQDQTGGKIQTCGNCATIIMDELAVHYVKVSEGDDFYEVPESLDCAVCHGDLPVGSVKFYGNAYPRGHRESQWYGNVCPKCIEPVTQTLYLAKAAQR